MGCINVSVPFVEGTSVPNICREGLLSASFTLLRLSLCPCPLWACLLPCHLPQEGQQPMMHPPSVATASCSVMLRFVTVLAQDHCYSDLLSSVLTNKISTHALR